MNIQRGAFRLWVVIAVLWTGFVCWSLPGDIADAWSGGCFYEDGFTSATPPTPAPPLTPEQKSQWTSAGKEPPVPSRRWLELGGRSLRVAQPK
jgi:hypothetical protein